MRLVRSEAIRGRLESHLEANLMKTVLSAIALFLLFLALAVETCLYLSQSADSKSADTVELVRLVCNKQARAVAGGGSDGFVRLYPLTEKLGDPTLLKGGHRAGIRSIAIDTAGKRMASGDQRGLVIIWDVVEKRILTKTQLQDMEVSAMLFSPDDKALMIAMDDTIVVLDTEKWEAKQKLQMEGGGIKWLCLSRDGKLLFAGGWSDVIICCDARTGKPVRKFAAKEVGIECMVLSAKDELLATGSGDGTIRIYDVGTAKLEKVLGHNGAVTSILFVGDAGLLVTGSRDETVKVWDWQKGRSEKIFEFKGAVTAVQLSPSGNELIVGTKGFFDGGRWHGSEVALIDLPKELRGK
jgi:WD40 repeat protein